LKIIVRDRIAKNTFRKFIQKFGIWESQEARQEVLRRRRRQHKVPEKLCNKEFHNLLSFPNIIRLATPDRWEMTNSFEKKFLIEKFRH
jgi:hypothetical protein